MKENEFPSIEVAACHVEPEGLFVHGYPQTEICGNLTYTEVFFLTTRGRLPTEAETKVLDAVFCGMIGYSYWSIARTIVSANPQPFPAFIGSFLTGGNYTTFPQHCAEEILKFHERMKNENLTKEETAAKVVEEYDKSRVRMPGMGHPLFRKIDPRAEAVRKVAEKYGFVGEKTLLFEAVHAEYVKNPKRAELCINIDGRFACTLLELGFEPAETTIVAVLSLAPGILADIVEQLHQKPSLALMVGLPSSYVGKPDRHLPQEYIRE